MIHELKVWPEYYERLVDGSKTFEVRNDRGFQTGDTLVLKEWDPWSCDYTGRETRRIVGFIYVVMSLLPVEEAR